LNKSWSHTKKNYLVAVDQKIKVGGKKTKKHYEEVIRESSDKFALTVGLRSGYTAINNEFYLTPRVSVSYFPRLYMVRNERVARRNLSYRFSTGLYYQPPFYREFRTFDGQLNTNVKAQKSFHAVAGTDFFFNMWNREQPFKFTGELFYKYFF
jgi:hypothetical protein